VPVPLAIVIETDLPDGDGLDVIQSVRLIDADCPVVVVTRSPSTRGRRRALDAGAAGYLVKPFSVPDLLALVARLLHGRG
jgi:DNA-binding response OmpR family regulator